MNLRQRTGAGGIDHAIGTMQVQPVGNSSRNDISQQAGERILLPGDVAFRYPLDDIIRNIIRHPRVLESLSPARVTESRAQRNHHLQRPRHTQNATDARTVELASGSVACMFQRPLGSDHAEQLRCVDGFEVVGRDPIFERIERHGRQESAAPRVCHVGRFLI